MIDKLLMDIWKCSTSVSGCRSPAAVFVFGGLKLKGMESYIKKIEHAMSPDTVVVGDSCCQFMYSNSMGEYTSSAIGVALVFMVDKDKPSGMGETLFNAILSSRLSPVSPAYNIAEAFVKTNYTWYGASATTKVSPEDIHAKTILGQVYDKVGCDTTFYVGITKRRKCYTGQDTVETTFLAFHEFLGREKNYLFVFGKDIKTGDSFRIYHANSDTAASSITSICDRSLSFKQGSITGDAKEVFGGIIFSPTFADPCVYSSPFLDNFPGVTLAGTFCGGLFGRGYSPSIEEGAVPCRMHKCSALYLVMSYTPPNRNQEFVGEKGGKEKCKQVAG